MLGADDSSYRNGLFFLKVLFPYNYPNNAPEVRFITPIYQVNVNHRPRDVVPLGKICISILHRFSPKNTMREVFCDIFVLINYLGNYSLSPIESDIEKEMRINRKLYEEKIKYFTKKYASITKDEKESQSWDFTYKCT